MTKARSTRRKATTLPSGRAPRRAVRQTVKTSDDRTAASLAVASEVFDVAVNVDCREFAKLGDALRAVQLQLGRTSFVLDGHVPTIDNTDQRKRRGAEILSSMTAGACSVEGILTLVTLLDYPHLRARQLTRRSRRAA